MVKDFSATSWPVPSRRGSKKRIFLKGLKRKPPKESCDTFSPSTVKTILLGQLLTNMITINMATFATTIIGTNQDGPL